MAVAWNQYPVGNPWNPAGGEYGVDLNTPFHTPITALYGGIVEKAYYAPWGGSVVIGTNLPGIGPVNEYVQHLDTIANGIVQGAQVHAGDFLGLSGGQLQGGYHPEPMYYQGHLITTGPHTEFGFGAPWQGGGPNFNPVNYLGGGPVNPQNYQPLSSMSAGQAGNASASQPWWCWFFNVSGSPQVCSMTSAQQSGVFMQQLQSLGLYVGGALLIMIGLWALLKKSPVTVVTQGGLTKGGPQEEPKEEEPKEEGKSE